MLKSSVNLISTRNPTFLKFLNQRQNSLKTYSTHDSQKPTTIFQLGQNSLFQHQNETIGSFMVNGSFGGFDFSRDFKESLLAAGPKTFLFFITNSFAWSDIVKFKKILENELGIVAGADSTGLADHVDDLNRNRLVGGVVDAINNDIGWSLTVLPHDTIRPFYSYPGSVRKAKSVGRWHIPSKRTTHNSSASSSVPLSFQSISRPGRNQQLDQKDILFTTEKDILPNQEVESILALNDSEPFDFYQHVDERFPNASKASFIFK